MVMFTYGFIHVTVGIKRLSERVYGCNKWGILSHFILFYFHDIVIGGTVKKYLLVTHHVAEKRCYFHV